MENIKELYVLGQPIDTKIGQLHFVKVKDYPKFVKYTPYLELDKITILKAIAKIDKDIVKEMKDVSFLTLITELKDVFEVYDVFRDLFLYLFEEDVFDKVESDEDLEYYKDLIRKMNNLSHEEKNPNPEIQYFIELKKKYKQNKSNGEISFESIYTSVWTHLGISPDNLTIYQMYALFSRIGQFKNYETTTLYSTVSGEVKIEPWYKHIDLNKKDEEKTSLDEFTKNANNILG